MPSHSLAPPATAGALEPPITSCHSPLINRFAVLPRCNWLVLQIVRNVCHRRATQHIVVRSSRSDRIAQHLVMHSGRADTTSKEAHALIADVALDELLDFEDKFAH